MRNLIQRLLRIKTECLKSAIHNNANLRNQVLDTFFCLQLEKDGFHSLP